MEGSHFTPAVPLGLALSLSLVLPYYLFTAIASDFSSKCEAQAPCEVYLKNKYVHR